MKALIIENEYEVDASIKAFLKDNPSLFESVKEQTMMLHRGGFEGIYQDIMETDAIVVASTWMYKDQLNDFLDAFLNPAFTKKLKFFIHAFTSKLNSWKHESSSWQREEKELFEKIKKVFQAGHEVYDYSENYNTNGEDVEDEFHALFNFTGEIMKRKTYGYFQMKYSEKHDLFYIDHEYYNLEAEVEEFITNKKQ